MPKDPARVPSSKRGAKNPARVPANARGAKDPTRTPKNATPVKDVTRVKREPSSTSHDAQTNTGDLGEKTANKMPLSRIDRVIRV